jgi:RimJ/RimL family protein N-acetyltransferase
MTDPAGAAPAVLVTQRLVLRRWVDEDLAPFAQLNADPEVMRFFQAPLAQADSDALVGRIRAALDRDGFGLWAVEEVGGAPFIGFVGLVRQTFQAHFTPAVEVGWRLARGSWGRGYAPEAARAALAVAFGPLALDEVVSMTSAGNVNSRRVMAKLGMHRDPADDFEHPAIAEGHPLRPHVLYRLTSQDRGNLVPTNPDMTMSELRA